jgi:TetR/AcrR family transcriptional repressor of nem operon
MRVSKEQAAQNHRKIVTAASRLFRERGINATGVDAITEDAGLTHGAVYSQFGSKEAIAAEAMREALAGSRRLWRRLLERNGRGKAFPAIVARYLSRDHRDSTGTGCVVAALGSEIGKQPARVRDAFTAELEQALDFIAGLMPRTSRSRSYEDAIAAFTSMAAELILARPRRQQNDQPAASVVAKPPARVHPRDPAWHCQHYSFMLNAALRRYKADLT